MRLGYRKTLLDQRQDDLSYLNLKTLDYNFDATNIIRGYSQFFHQLISRVNNIERILKGINLGKHPIRTILRDSRKYMDIIPNDLLERPMILEEKIQIDRGDVPYFFKFFNQPDSLFYFSSENKDFKKVHIPDYFSRDVKRIGMDLKFIFSPIRFQRIYESGLLFLSNFIYSEQNNFLFESPQISILGNQNQVKLNFCNGRTVVSKRLFLKT